MTRATPAALTVPTFTAPSYVNPAYVADVIALADALGDKDLFDFAGKAETEYMLSCTIRAAATNAKAGKAPCSMRADDCRGSSDGGLVDNDTGYAKMLDDGWVEAMTVHRSLCPNPLTKGVTPTRRGNVTLLWPKPLFLAALRAYCLKNRYLK